MEKRLLITKQELKPTRPDFEVIGVFNSAITTFKDGYVMIARVAEKVLQTDKDSILVPHYSHRQGICIRKLPKDSPEYDYSDSRIIKNHSDSFLTSVSHLRIFRSFDGIHFDLENATFIFPDNIYEEYGLEDPRITRLENSYYVTFTAVSSNGINVRLMKTDDFVTFKRMGNIFHSDNKDCVIFPEKVKGRYFALHRPSISQFGKLDIWTATSQNLSDWGNHQIMLQARIAYQESIRVGAGAVPFLTDKGWVAIYHSADGKHNYHLTAMLLDRDDPNLVRNKSLRPLVYPTETYERSGFVNNVVFTCGAIDKPDAIWIYYGACDECVAMCKLTYAELWDNLGVSQK